MFACRRDDYEMTGADVVAADVLISKNDYNEPLCHNIEEPF